MEVDEQLLNRREVRRLQRQQQHHGPVRWRLSLSAAMVALIGLGTIVTVTWLNSSADPEAEPAETEVGLHQLRGEDQTTDMSHGPENPHSAEQRTDDAEAGGGETSELASVVVYVTGAVAQPQVVELDEGARVAEAVEAAGGLSEDAAVEGVNLAAVAADGSLIYVPTTEELDQGHSIVPGEAPQAISGSSETDPTVNINTADADELQRLPGIGPALAERVISYREEHGGFSSLEELSAVSGIGPSVLEGLADEVSW